MVFLHAKHDILVVRTFTNRSCIYFLHIKDPSVDLQILSHPVDFLNQLEFHIQEASPSNWSLASLKPKINFQKPFVRILQWSWSHPSNFLELHSIVHQLAAGLKYIFIAWSTNRYGES